MVHELPEELTQAGHVLGIPEPGAQRGVIVEVEAELAVVAPESSHDEPRPCKAPPRGAVLVHAALVRFQPGQELRHLPRPDAEPVYVLQHAGLLHVRS